MRGWAAGRPVSLDLFQEVKHDFFSQKRGAHRPARLRCFWRLAWCPPRLLRPMGLPRRPRMQLQAMTRLPCWWNPAIQPPAGVSTMASPLPFQRRSLLPAKMRKMSRETMAWGRKTRVFRSMLNSVVPGTGIHGYRATFGRPVGATRIGIDVSEHNGRIDWQVVKRAGVETLRSFAAATAKITRASMMIAGSIMFGELPPRAFPTASTCTPMLIR